MLRIMLGQGRRRIRNPSWSVPTSNALEVDDIGDHAGHGQRAGAGLGGTAPGMGAIRMPAGFGLPPGVDDGAAAFADDAVIPFPGGGIDRLADRTEQAQARKIVRVGPMVALADQRADGGGRSVENVDAIFFDDAPPAVELRDSRERLRTSRWSRPPRAVRRRCSCGR